MGRLEHVGLNAVFLRPRFGGLETYVRSLVPEIVAARPGLRLTLFVNPEEREYLAGAPWLDGVSVVSHPLIGRRYTSAMSELALMGPLAARHGVDLLHSLAMTGPLRTRMPHVVNVHDLIWWRVPDSAERATTLVWRAAVPPVARRADRVITLSRATRDDVVELLRVPPERIDVVHLGSGFEPAPAEPEDEVRRRLALGDGPVVLAVSAKRTHKNLIRLVRAMRRVRERFPGAVLVIPGNPTPHEQEIRAEAERIGLSDAVRLPPYARPGELETLYALCAVSVFPSLIEGFGLPLLEAMLRGVPVACSNVSALPEVAGDAARYFDPYDEASIAQALIDVIGDEALRARLGEAGRARAAGFSWRATAEGTLESWERALAGRR
jgi:glycosyltransferase involved in cell wall biosynthesis